MEMGFIISKPYFSNTIKRDTGSSSSNVGCVSISSIPFMSSNGGLSTLILDKTGRRASSDKQSAIKMRVTRP